jgi:ubiquinone/menaquinone biosynthesis C-methylase UbiE
MSEQERWQLAGSAPEIYERHLVPAIFAPWAPVLTEQAALNPGERVLDVACGTGVVARLAAEQVGLKGEVVGLDLNRGVLDVARSLPSVQGATIEWREGDVGSLPFAEAFFDVVFCQLGLQYFPDRGQAAREMHRVLKAGGRLLALVWRALAHSPGFAVLAAALERHVSPAAKAVMEAPLVFGDGVEELRGLFRQAGFNTARIHSDVRMVRFASPEAFVQYQVAGSPLANHVAEVGEAVQQALVQEVSAAMGAYMNDAGLVFPIEAHIVIAPK